jgi:hypothetical protein
MIFDRAFAFKHYRLYILDMLLCIVEREGSALNTFRLPEEHINAIGTQIRLISEAKTDSVSSSLMTNNRLYNKVNVSVSRQKPVPADHQYIILSTDDIHDRASGNGENDMEYAFDAAIIIQKHGIRLFDRDASGFVHHSTISIQETCDAIRMKALQFSTS